MNHAHAVLTLVSVLAFGIASHDSDAQQLVRATLLSNAIQLDAREVEPGAVTLEVHNAAPDRVVHELVVLKTDLAEDALPVRKGAVPERKFRKIGEVEDVAPGKSKRLALTLAPGHYVLICNKPGHYSMGMHASLAVTP
jgi:uncharacterized cupredoxin-like copper-binding protein